MNIKKFLDPIHRRITNLLTRSKVISVNSSDSIYVALSTVRGKPSPEEIKMMQHFGFASVPPKDTDHLRVHLSGNADNPLSIASHHSDSQPTDLVEGDTALFDDHDQFIKLKVQGITIYSQTGDINVNAFEGDINLDAPSGSINATTLTANITATSQVNVTSPLAKFSGIVEALGFKTIAGLILETHRHNENDNGGPTDGPIN